MHITFSWYSSLDGLYRLQTILQVFIVVAGVMGAGAGYSLFKVQSKLKAFENNKARSEIEATQSQLNRANNELSTLKAAQAPRQITEEQSIRLQQKLRALPALSRIMVTYDESNHETCNFARRFSDIFTAIGWQNTNIIYGSAHARSNEGTALVVRKDATQRLKPWGDAIVAAFRSEGIKMYRLGQWDVDKRDPSAEVEIRVGQKPLE